MNYKNISKEKDENQKKVVLENLKSDYFLGIIFDYTKKNKFLEIIKYNKKLQRRLKLSLDDYKEFSELYTPIVIELKLNDIDDLYTDSNYFININENEEEENYHIYFDNSNEEIKRKYLNKNDKVKKIKIIIDYEVMSLRSLFAFCNSINTITFKKFYRNNITDMSDMFYFSSSIKEINFLSFNSTNVTDMCNMFKACESLIKLDLSNFNTENVTDMISIFNGCSSLEKLNISSFNTSNLYRMSNMFFGCSSLKKLDISDFNTDKVTDMKEMFSRCSSL